MEERTRSLLERAILFGDFVESLARCKGNSEIRDNRFLRAHQSMYLPSFTGSSSLVDIDISGSWPDDVSLDNVVARWTRGRDLPAICDITPSQSRLIGVAREPDIGYVIRYTFRPDGALCEMRDTLSSAKVSIPSLSGRSVRRTDSLFSFFFSFFLSFSPGTGSLQTRDACRSAPPPPAPGPV